MTNQWDSIIVGAGLAGIATAVRLRKKGQRVLELERNRSLGGNFSDGSWCR
jgi:phytoene dehydrogenase-like protein